MCEVSGFAGVVSLIFESREESAADGDGAGVEESFSEVFSVEAVDGSGAEKSATVGPGGGRETTWGGYLKSTFKNL